MYLRIKSLDHPAFAAVERLRVQFTYLTPEYPVNIHKKWLAAEWIMMGDPTFEELGISRSMSMYSCGSGPLGKTTPYSYVAGVGGAHSHGGKKNTISTVFSIKEVHCGAGVVLKDKIDIRNYLFPYSEDVYEEGMDKYDLRTQKFYDFQRKGIDYTLGPHPISVD
jgi:hypothetical protein